LAAYFSSSVAASGSAGSASHIATSNFLAYYWRVVSAPSRARSSAYFPAIWPATASYKPPAVAAWSASYFVMAALILVRSASSLALVASKAAFYSSAFAVALSD